MICWMDWFWLVYQDSACWAFCDPCLPSFFSPNQVSSSTSLYPPSRGLSTAIFLLLLGLWTSTFIYKVTVVFTSIPQFQCQKENRQAANHSLFFLVGTEIGGYQWNRHPDMVFCVPKSPARGPWDFLYILHFWVCCSVPTQKRGRCQRFVRAPLSLFSSIFIVLHGKWTALYSLSTASKLSDAKQSTMT